MRIAILASEFYPPYGGVGIYTQQLVKELSKRHEVHVFTAKRVPKKEVLNLFHNRIKLHYLCKAKGDFAYNFIFQIKLFFNFLRFHKKYRYDIIHSMNLVNMPDIFLKFKHNIPTVVTAHSSIWTQMDATLSSNKNIFQMGPSERGSLVVFPIIAFLEWLYLKKTKYMITVSNEFVKYFKKRGFKKKIFAVHNGIDPKIYDHKKVKKRKDIMEQKGLKVLFVGRLLAQKGIKVLVKAMKEFDDDVHFYVAGNGGVKEFHELLKNNGIPKSKATFLGFIKNNDLPTVYKACDVFVLPSFSENFPITLLEAMSMKCATISSDVGAVKELIKDKKTGILLRPGSVEDLVNAIRMLKDDKRLREKIARDAYYNVLNNLTTDSMARNTEKIYMDILKNRGMRR